VRKQRNDRRDVQHILKLMLKDDFPRLWVPTPENRDVRQLVWHRHRLVQMRNLQVRIHSRAVSRQFLDAIFSAEVGQRTAVGIMPLAILKTACTKFGH